MILLAMQLAFAPLLIQEPAPGAEPASKPERVERVERVEGGKPQAESDEDRRRREWWDDLPEEKRRELEDRRRRFDEMTPEEREELRERMKVLRAERNVVLKEMGEEERAAFDAMDGHAQRDLLDRVARERLAERSGELEAQIPNARERLDRPDFRGRAQASAEMMEEYRRDHIARAVDRYLEDGWIGPSAAEWLRIAPLHEAMVTIGEIEKWRFLARARAEGLWEEAGVSEEEQERLIELPGPEFFREARAAGLRTPWRGRRGGPGGERHGEFGDRRDRGERGDREDRGDDRRPREEPQGGGRRH